MILMKTVDRAMQYHQLEIGTQFTLSVALDAPIMKKVRKSTYQDPAGLTYVVRSEYMSVYPLKRLAKA